MQILLMEQRHEDTEFFIEYSINQTNRYYGKTS